MKFVIGNWKMRLSVKESVELSAAAARCWTDSDKVAVVVCPSHEALSAAADRLRGTPVALGAQDAFWEDKGAFTGEVSAMRLADLGCSYCIVGHSERRRHLRETDEMVNRKISAVLRNGLTPIVCVGESLEERQGGRQDEIAAGQLRAALSGLKVADGGRLIVAYEPLWAIGTGMPIEPADASAVHLKLAEVVRETMGEAAAAGAAIIYGGSVDSKNAGSFLKAESIDGVLVGGASLDSEEFIRIAEAARSVQ